MRKTWNMKLRFSLICLLLSQAVVWDGGAEVMAQRQARGSDAAYENPQGAVNKAGLYLRMAKNQRERDPEFYLSHPLVDAVVVSFGWSELEPRAGHYEFKEIERILTLCRRYQKGLVLQVSTYGQSPDDQPTPDWLYEKGVAGIEFFGGGVAHGRSVSVPKVWDHAYLEQYERFVEKLAAQFDGDPSVWFVMPGYGHIGNLVAQPSRGGRLAFIQAGWTPEIWKEYCLQVSAIYQRAFRKTRLIAKLSPMLLRDRRHDFYKKELGDLVLAMAKRGISFVGFGLDPDEGHLSRSGIFDIIKPLIPMAKDGTIRLGFGDDWPLWVPSSRRETQRFLRGRDEAGLDNLLKFAFGDVNGLPKTYITILYVLHPEIEASHPKKGNEQNQRVFELLKSARDRLKAA